MSILSKITIPAALLIGLALCPESACSSAASTGVVSPVPVANATPAGPPTGPVAVRPPAAPALSRRYSFSTSNSRAATPVLVIPAQEMAPETYDRVLEDLSVMSRIIEKSLRTESEGPYGSLVTANLYTRGDFYGGHTLFLPSDSAGPQILRSSGGRPKAIYVGGYGVVFSLRVGFPLVPPPEAPKSDKTTEQEDPVWAAAQRELADPEGSVRTRRTRPATEPYKAEAVENLKNTLTAALKHASNLRDLEPESWLLVLVQGPAAGPEQPQDPTSSQTLDPTAPGTGGTLLTLRAKKADIDQFAKGQLDETQFRQRVQSTAR